MELILTSIEATCQLRVLIQKAETPEGILVDKRPRSLGWKIVQ